MNAEITTRNVVVGREVDNVQLIQYTCTNIVRCLVRNAVSQIK